MTMAVSALRTLRRSAALAAGALTILVVTAVGAEIGTAAAAGTTPACATSGLVVWLDTQGSGTAGSTYYQLELTNLSGHACTIFGYPGVSAVDLRGRQVGSAASRNAAHEPRRVTLTNGATAKTVLRIVDVDNFPAPPCRPVTAAGLRVYPPNQTAAKIVPFPFRACSRVGTVSLSVEAVQKA